VAPSSLLRIWVYKEERTAVIFSGSSWRWQLVRGRDHIGSRSFRGGNGKEVCTRELAEDDVPAEYLDEE